MFFFLQKRDSDGQHINIQHSILNLIRLFETLSFKLHKFIICSFGLDFLMGANDVETK